MRRAIVGALTLSILSGVAHAAEVAVGPDARAGLAVTLYRDLAFVRDARRTTLIQGLNELAFPGVSRVLQPETVQLSAPGVRVVERRFEADVVTLLIDSPRAGPAEIELGYLTSGLSWRADYVASLDASGRRMRLELLATVANESGADYPRARLALIAGEVARAQPPVAPVQRGVVAMAAEMAPGVAEAPAGDYRRFAVERPVDLARGARTQVALLSAVDVPVERIYRLSGRPSMTRPAPSPAPVPVDVLIAFANAEAAGLGLPLPAGTLRVYSTGTDAAFLGEAPLPATPKNERAELLIGRAFDVTARRSVTDYREEGPRNALAIETTQRIVLSNAKAEPVTVEVVESPLGEGNLFEESQRHEALSALQHVWRVAVPANGSATLSYRVRVNVVAPGERR